MSVYVCKMMIPGFSSSSLYALGFIFFLQCYLRAQVDFGPPRVEE